MTCGDLGKGSICNGVHNLIMVSGAEVIDGFVGTIGQEVEACVVLVKTVAMRGGCVILGEVHKELDHVWCKYVF